MFRRFALFPVVVALAGCGSPYPDIRPLAEASPGIEIEDAELIAYQGYREQYLARRVITGVDRDDLFLSSNWDRDRVREFYQASYRGYCIDEPNGILTCFRTVRTGITVRVALGFDFSSGRTAIRRLWAGHLPVL